MGKQKQKVLLVICPNGLGHYKRSLSICARLLAKYPQLELHVATTEWQLERWPLQELDPVLDSRVRVLPGLTEPGIHWALDPTVYRDGRLLSLEDKLKKLMRVEAYDHVISDNLTAVLNLHPKAVLMGSFLWSDVLEYAYPQEKAVQEFVKYERDILQRTRPPMICVRYFALAGVKDRTQAIPVGLMVNPPIEKVGSILRNGRKKIGILAGIKSPLPKLFSSAIPKILKETDWDLCLDPRLFHGLVNTSPRVSAMDFSLKGYLQCDLLLARPGLGTIHNALESSTPIISAYEKNQLEMEHIGRSLEGLNLGLDQGHSENVDALLDRMSETKTPEFQRQYFKSLEELDFTGYKTAANWLANRLELS